MVPLSGTETMHDQKDFSRYSDPAWSFYAEPLTSFPLLALVDEDWMPFSFKANHDWLERVSGSLGVEYQPEPERLQRRLLAAAVNAADEFGMKIVITGTRYWDSDPDDLSSTEPVLVCLYSDWPGQHLGTSIFGLIPASARLVHSVIATSDLVGCCLRVVRSLEDLKIMGPGAPAFSPTNVDVNKQFPAVA
jgi:hypothetical protein